MHASIAVLVSSLYSTYPPNLFVRLRFQQDPEHKGGAGCLVMTKMAPNIKLTLRMLKL
jgi:hypothetical protein